VNILVSLDEIADGQKCHSVLGDSKGINAEIVLEPRDQDRKRKGVKARLVEREIVIERRQPDRLLFGNPLYRCHNFRSSGHEFNPLSFKPKVLKAAISIVRIKLRAPLKLLPAA